MTKKIYMPPGDESTPFFTFLDGGGEVAERIRAYDWEKTSLGRIEHWPLSLRNSLSLILKSRFPMFLFWGADHLCFYNDAYIPTFGDRGKHPQALGKRGELVWAEIWHVLLPVITSVMNGEGASWVEDQRLELLRNDRLEETYWTYSYSAIVDEYGKAKGVFCVTSETTNKIVTLREVEESRRNFRKMILQSPVAMCILRGRDLIVEIANAKMYELWGKTEGTLHQIPIFEGLPEAREQGLEEILDKVYTTGETFIANEMEVVLPRNGRNETVYINFSYQAVREGDGQVSGILAVAVDVTEQVRARYAVELSERRYRGVLEAIAQMTWINTPTGEISFFNQQWYDYTGLSFEETKGWAWMNCIHPEDISSTMEAYQNGLQSGEIMEVENRYRRADGEYRWHLNRATPVRNSRNEIEFWVGTATDIDEIKKLQQQKDDFLGIASHELKTPLTSANAYLQLMDRTIPEDHNLKKFVQNALKQLNRLERLTADLLDVSKINTGKLPYEYQEFNFCNLLNDAVSSIQETVSTHRLVIEESVDFMIHGDYHRLEQVINNFISNAVKYSPGADKVIIRAREIRGQLVVSFQDFGVGIPQDKVNKLFERFYRIEDTAMRFQGLGLGLFIVSEILQRHKGRFWIESVVGEGSTFYFMLPPAHAAEAEPKIVVTDDSFIDSHVSITLNKPFNFLEVRWEGFLDYDSVKLGCMEMLKLLRRHKCHLVLNDNRNVLGTWSDAAEWVGKTWLPMMEEAGLTHFGWVHSYSTFSQLSANKSIDVMAGHGRVVTRTFSNEGEAVAWLKRLATGS